MFPARIPRITRSDRSLIYDHAANAEKKAIASAIFKTVTLSRDYGISIEFNISEVQYLNGMEMKL